MKFFVKFLSSSTRSINYNRRHPAHSNLSFHNLKIDLIYCLLMAYVKIVVIHWIFFFFFFLIIFNRINNWLLNFIVVNFPIVVRIKVLTSVVRHTITKAEKFSVLLQYSIYFFDVNHCLLRRSLATKNRVNESFINNKIEVTIFECHVTSIHFQKVHFRIRGFVLVLHLLNANRRKINICDIFVADIVEAFREFRITTTNHQNFRIGIFLE